MPLASVILVEPAHAGNLGATLRVAANFGVPHVDLVKPRTPPDDPEVLRWACGAHERVTVRTWDAVSEAVAEYRTLVASASGRGRENQPLISPAEATAEISRRGISGTALMFGNETSGLRRDDLDRCDFAVRIPTEPSFPVLNLVQSIAILLAHVSMFSEPTVVSSPDPARVESVDGMMGHLEESLLAIGFLDPVNPQRLLRKLRRLFGRAGITEDEVTMIRGICRQALWAARTGPLRDDRE